MLSDDVSCKTKFTLLDIYDLKRQKTVQVSQMQTIYQTIKTACYMTAKSSEIML